MNLPQFAVRKPLTVYVIFIGLCLVGAVALVALPTDLLPEIEPPAISVVTVYPGAGAADVEEQVTETIEEFLSPISGMREITSISKDNTSVITCHMDWGANLDEFMSDIRARMEMAKIGLPGSIKPSIIFKFDTSLMPVLILAVSLADGDIREHLDFVEDRISEPLMRLDGVGSAWIMGATRRQVIVEIDRAQLDAYGLPLKRVANAIQSENLSLPAGNLKIGREEYVLRLPAEFRSLEHIRDVIIGRHGDATIRLRDVAKVSHGFEETNSIAEVDRRPILELMVMKRSGANTIEVVDQVRKKLDEISNTLPPGLEFRTFGDSSAFIRASLGNLSKALYLACVLVALVVLVFLGKWRSSLIVALTIPASMVVAFAGLYVFGYTINLISLASMAVAVGMVVDNAIVVIENIGRHIESGKDPREAASSGAWEVGRAVIASTVTTIAIFAPLVFSAGIIGILFRQLALVITATLVASLAAALLLTPALSSRLLRREEDTAGRRRAIFRAGKTALAFVEDWYSRLLDRTLEHRKKVIAGAIWIFACSFLLIAVIDTGFVPKMDAGEVRITIELPAGTRLERTAKVAGRIAEIIRKKVPEARHIGYSLGESQSGGLGLAMGMRAGPNIANIQASVGPVAERNRSTFEIAAALRPEIEKIPGITSMQMSAGHMAFEIATRSEKPILIELLGTDLKSVQEAGTIAKEIVEKTPGTVDIFVDLAAERPELRVEIDRKRASRLEVSAAAIADTLRTAVHGSDVTRFRGQANDVDIHLQMAQADRRGIEDIKNLTVISQSGAPVKLGNIAQVAHGRTPVEIRHLDQQIVARISAGIEGRSLGKVAADLERALLAAKFPSGVKVKFGGEVEEQREAGKGFLLALAIAILLIYMVMVIQFESLLHPFVIMFSVPFAFTGVLLAHAMTGTDLCIGSFLGTLLLVGVVVNNAIVIVDYINQLRAQGLALREAVRTAASRRLRPVLMTTLTTAFGMLPVALAGGEGYEFWRPMGVAVIGGLLFSTLITLVLVPTLYSLFAREEVVA